MASNGHKRVPKLWFWGILRRPNPAPHALFFRPKLKRSHGQVHTAPLQVANTVDAFDLERLQRRPAATNFRNLEELSSGMFFRTWALDSRDTITSRNSVLVCAALGRLL
ncbi:hypothetical protein ACN47E_000188 [Coniothyrium glycines]